MKGETWVYAFPHANSKVSVALRRDPDCCAYDVGERQCKNPGRYSVDCFPVCARHYEILSQRFDRSIARRKP